MPGVGVTQGSVAPRRLHKAQVSPSEDRPEAHRVKQSYVDRVRLSFEGVAKSRRDRHAWAGCRLCVVLNIDASTRGPVGQLRFKCGKLWLLALA